MMRATEGCEFDPLLSQPAELQEGGHSQYQGRWVGARMDISKGQDFLRVAFLNVRGAENGDKVHALKKLGKWNCDIIGLADTKFSETHNVGVGNAAKFYWATSRDGKRTEPLWVTARGNKGEHGYVGGVASIMQEALGRRSERRLLDFRKWGRWAGFQLIGRQRRKLAVITVYGPTQTASSPGSAWYVQQKQIEGLEEVGGLNPRELFLADLAALVVDCHMKGVAVVLGGNFNVNVEGLESWAEAINLCNISASWTDGYPTFIRNRETQTCIDHVLASGELVDGGFVNGVGVFTDPMWNSDHLTVIAEIKYRAYLGLLNTDLQSAGERRRRF